MTAFGDIDLGQQRHQAITWNLPGANELSHIFMTSVSFIAFFLGSFSIFLQGCTPMMQLEIVGNGVYINTCKYSYMDVRLH